MPFLPMIHRCWWLSCHLFCALLLGLYWDVHTGLIRERLHWLSLPERIVFKLATLTYKCISGRAPDYLCTGVESVEAPARLRSATAGRLLLPTTDTVTVGRRGFYYASPDTWNSLPPHMTHMSMSLFSFRKLLKTLLFHWHYTVIYSFR